jgi:hypothetical protein
MPASLYLGADRSSCQVIALHEIAFGYSNSDSLINVNPSARQIASDGSFSTDGYVCTKRRSCFRLRLVDQPCGRRARDPSAPEPRDHGPPDLRPLPTSPRTLPLTSPTDTLAVRFRPRSCTSENLPSRTELAARQAARRLPGRGDILSFRGRQASSLGAGGPCSSRFDPNFELCRPAHGSLPEKLTIRRRSSSALWKS